MPTPSQHAFSEKVALITDGTNPVGQAVALQLALCGSYVIVGFSRSTEEVVRALEELTSLGTLANAFEYNSSTVAGAENLVAEVENLYGRLDLLVNCLKFEGVSEFENITEEVFDKSLDLGLKAPFFIMKEALRLMKRRPKPKIVNVVSAVDTLETERDIVFASVNRALVGMTRSLAKTLPEKFRINAVAVSERERAPTHFEKFDKFDAELFRVKKGIDPDDVARTILYLLSSEAIGLNGQIIKVE